MYINWLFQEVSEISEIAYLINGVLSKCRVYLFIEKCEQIKYLF